MPQFFFELAIISKDAQMMFGMSSGLRELWEAMQSLCLILSFMPSMWNKQKTGRATNAQVLLSDSALELVGLWPDNTLTSGMQMRTLKKDESVEPAKKRERKNVSLYQYFDIAKKTRICKMKSQSTARKLLTLINPQPLAL